MGRELNLDDKNGEREAEPLKPFLLRLKANLQEYLTPPWPLLVVGFSGGRDSVALLHALWQLGQMEQPETAPNFALLAAHFNHGLRGAEADADQEFCRDFCSRLGIEFCWGQAQGLNRGGDVENRARRQRYAWLEQTCQQEEAKGFGSVWLLCAHHLEDQAETVLLHLLRGSGSAGLAAMRKRRGRLLRPLLDVQRADIEAYLTANGLSWRDDSTNSSLVYTRNRVRGQLLPLLQQLNPQAAPALAQTAEIAAAEADFLAACVAERMQQATVLPEGAAMPLDFWQKQPLAMQRLLVRALWQAAAQRPVCALSFEQTEAVRLLPLHKTIHLPGGLAAVKNRGWLRLLRQTDEALQRRRAKSRAGHAKNLPKK